MKLKKADTKTLAQFQCEKNRATEELFAQILSERGDLRLFFINENEPYTDGRNIVVDPAYMNLFADRKALGITEQLLCLDGRIGKDPWLALSLVTRALTIHESLHIIYSNFPSGAKSDERATAPIRLRVLLLLNNIIEDAFIEAAACSIYDNLEPHLLWFRCATCFANTKIKSTTELTFARLREEAAPQEPGETSVPVFPDTRLIQEYLEYMGCFLLLPMVRQGEPAAELLPYVEQTKQLFQAAMFEGDPDCRYGYVRQIFDLVEPLIPAGGEFASEFLRQLLAGQKTQNADDLSIKPFRQKGRKTKVYRGFFDDKDEPYALSEGKWPTDALEAFIGDAGENKEQIQTMLNAPAIRQEYSGKDFDCARIHQGITIRVERPKINFNLRRAYQNIYDQYRININTYNARFAQLLKGAVDEREEKQLFGSGLDTRHLGDVKRRRWYRQTRGAGIPDLAVLLLLDGSGSMSGRLREGAITSSLILHEVLRKNRIQHAIVEHRAIYDEPVLEHNILISFAGREEEKYRLLQLQADEGTREGLSLYWAERYLSEQSFAEHKLILMLSDGAPAHRVDDSAYYPPVSTKDTANAVRKITGRGTKLAAIALDRPGQDRNYRALKEMYPSVISCTDLGRLTGQLLNAISRELA
jgi:hypothetical protein